MIDRPGRQAGDARKSLRTEHPPVRQGLADRLQAGHPHQPAGAGRYHRFMRGRAPSAAARRPRPLRR
ncbi:MAG: hypothetical protein MZV70_11040 [Desulfobacterales bacterium]|nr:hypothetical protein [Desulfobacterales bacterium]